MLFRSLPALAGAILVAVLCLGSSTSSAATFGVAGTSTLSGSEDEPSAIQGDADCSQGVTLSDVSVILQHSAGIGAAPCGRAADIQCDGDVDTSDALQLVTSLAGMQPSQDAGCAAVGEALPPVQTSEELIAAALANGDISYEDSLRYRAFALFNDPRLPDEYRSLIIDWEAASSLFSEVDEDEGQLSAGLLADLAPYRARPNDPVSIFNSASSSSIGTEATGGWVGEAVPGTGVRVWIKGSVADLAPYKTALTTVWNALPGIFPYPLPDQPGNPTTEINPDNAIDVYIVDATQIDTRDRPCIADPNYVWYCRISNNYGLALVAPPDANRKSSGYLLVNKSRQGNDFIDTTAHELTHIAQYSFDNEEESWLKESTATWSEYKVLKKLGINPDYPYDRLPNVFQTLDQPLTREGTDQDLHKYGSWLFFYSASIDLGDDIVKTVWQKAAIPGLDGILAVDEAIPLDDNFPLYALRNWDQDPVQKRYNSQDSSFPSGYEPNPIQDISVGTPGIRELDKPVKNLAAVYYHYKFGPDIKRVTFENFLQGVDNAHVWAMAEIDGQWQPPEDWTDLPQKVYCRNKTSGVISDLVIIVSDSHDTQPLSGIMPRLLAEDIGCVGVEGWARATVHIDDGYMDMTYESGTVPLHFSQRDVQDVPGNIQYDLDAGSMTWTASGTYYGGDCPAEGQAIINFPGGQYEPTSLVGGYLNVVGLDGGDFHSIIIAAASSQLAITITCPGDPPQIEHDIPRAGYLLEILSQPNTHIGADAIYQGTQNLEVGPVTYHFEWELQPLTP
jgi:hypothetical protein